MRIGGDGNLMVLAVMICMNCKQVHFFNAIAVAMQKQMDDAAIEAATEGTTEH